MRNNSLLTLSILLHMLDRTGHQSQLIYLSSSNLLHRQLLTAFILFLEHLDGSLTLNMYSFYIWKNF